MCQLVISSLTGSHASHGLTWIPEVPTVGLAGVSILAQNVPGQRGPEIAQVHAANGWPLP